MRRYLLMFIVGTLLSLLLSAQVCLSDVPTHQNRNNLPLGCSTCHIGFNFSSGGGQGRCLICHSSGRMMEAGFGSRPSLHDVSKDYAKNYTHPTFRVTGKHSSREVLPERNPAAPRHADCADCHNPHFSSPETPYAGLSGKMIGNYGAPILKEYELCYRCHGESANLPPRATSKKVEFAVTNPSFHPVEGEGKNQAVLSLIRPYREKKTSSGDVSTLKCADCHSSDDPNAPRGPHGSKYRGILVDNFEVGDGLPESSYAYALCYRCHRRSSILGNETFPHHMRHITGERGFKGGGTSCMTCHSSHGSTENRYLLRFNRDYVGESSSGKLKFVEKGTYSFHGECWLTCHGVDHNPKSY